MPREVAREVAKKVEKAGMEKGGKDGEAVRERVSARTREWLAASHSRLTSCTQDVRRRAVHKM